MRFFQCKRINPWSSSENHGRMVENTIIFFKNTEHETLTTVLVLLVVQVNTSSTVVQYESTSRVNI